MNESIYLPTQKKRTCLFFKWYRFSFLSISCSGNGRNKRIKIESIKLNGKDIYMYICGANISTSKRTLLAILCNIDFNMLMRFLFLFNCESLKDTGILLNKTY